MTTGIQISGATIDGGVTISVTSGGGGGGMGSAVKFDIASISGSTVPDISGGGNDGTLVGTYNTGSDSHGSYVYLNGGYIDITGYNLSTPFTVRLIAAIDSSQTYWASLWGNETYASNKGYLAYLGSATALSAGPVGGTSYVTVSGVTSAAQWDFVIDGSSVAIYKNGTQVGTTHSYTGAPSGGDSANDLYVGSRHTNSGTGSLDVCKMKLYAFNVFTTAMSGSTIATDYATNQSTFNI